MMMNAATLAAMNSKASRDGKCLLDGVRVLVSDVCRDKEVVHGEVGELTALYLLIGGCEPRQARATLDFFLVSETVASGLPPEQRSLFEATDGSDC
jgi:hypothetical protein